MDENNTQKNALVENYLIDVKCVRCKKKLTDDEIVRIGRDKTLKVCDKDLQEIIAIQNKWAPKFLKMKLL